MDKPLNPDPAGILREAGPMLGSALAEALSARGLSAEAARKRVQRSSGEIRRLEHVRFGHGDRLYYLAAQDQLIGQSLRHYARAGRSAFRWPLEVLDAVGGAIEDYRFRAVSASPRGRKGRLSDVEIAEALLGDGVLSRLAIAGRGSFFALAEPFGAVSVTPKRLAAKSLAGGVLRNALHEWIRRNALGSFDKVMVRAADVDPVVSGYGWDITAPSFLWPLLSRTERGVKPGFLVCDSFIEPEFAAVEYFLSKVEAVAAHAKNRPLLPMIVSPGFSREAFDRLKRSGVIVTTPDNLFGRGVGRSLLRLVDLLANAAVAIAERGDEAFEGFSKVSKIEGAALNLRGALFEMIAGHCAREGEPGGFLDLGVPVPDSSGAIITDVDVLYRQKRTVLACECKGHSINTIVTDEEVAAWLAKLGRVRKWLFDEYRNPDVRFEFWTSGSFDDAARGRLDAAIAATKKYEIAYRDGAEMERQIRTLSGGHVAQLYREHFSRHPLAGAIPDLSIHLANPDPEEDFAG